MKLFKIVIIFSLTLAVLGCSESDDEQTPENEINDEEGLSIQLEWTTGGTTAEALEQVDLDMALNNGIEEITSSTNGSSFEEMELSSFYADGEYRVSIIAYATQSDSEFTLYIIGNDTQDRIEYAGSFTAADGANDAEYPAFVTITKSGSNYLITK